ncbi:MFS transporter [Microbacterium sp. zg.Y1090]|uniref:MFS transporter n=1 Tax=Microbacterium wangruii TaxID=3049073 RepID=UPI00214BB3C9|nr:MULTISPECIES: MFS transporter [unclassified Microbacterium]MCR2817729.1 MFS transporter [Microbacterium sp. zg.Y1090]MDL5485628.1 MFS transporter [Microbacterium sp. zg-Y1211]WIM28799.1 MFS transporter [Microbacterium sp. zg-Y1090]
MTTTTSAPHRLWRNRRYLTWLVSDTSRGLADGLYAFALPLLTLIVTDDPAQAGIVGAVGGAVLAVTTLYGGVLADRHPRIGLMILGSTIGVVLSLGFTVLAFGGSLTFAGLLVLTLLLGARAGLFDVAGESAIKQVVPDAAMGRAQAANQARDAALQLAGGPLGGALLAVGGWLIGAAMTLAQLIAAVSAWLLRGGGSGATESAPAPAATSDAPTARTKSSAAGEMRTAFLWLWARDDLRAVLFIATIINLGFNAGLTTVLYAMQQAGHSPAVIGWLSAGAGVAMLVGAVAAPALIPRVKAGVIAIAGLGVATAGVLALSQLETVWAIVGVLAASVLLLPALNAALMGYTMVAVPSELLGRVNSVSTVLAIGAMPLGPLIAGFGLTWVGREGTLLVCAALCGVATAMAVASRGLRALPTEGGWADHAARFARG